MAAQGEDVYASLLLTDSYLPGALVLAHSLRDAGTTKKLAILVTPDTVSAEVVTQLKSVYDYVIPVPRIRNDKPANLYLMNRPDLHSAFTKINLWKQTQFRKIVYIDADVVAYRAPEELFDLPHAFSAAPDIGWPDLFNTGVMALTPNIGDYYALLAMAERGISFDGADQGLLNMHFKNNFNRLSFTYNVTPSGHYQYVPAYKHFQSSISMVHFIGNDKPWIQGRDASTGDSPYTEMLGRWWAVYDRHYRRETSVPTITVTDSGSQTTQAAPPPELVQYFVKGEYQPRVSYVIPVAGASYEHASSSHDQAHGHQQGPPPPAPEQKPEPPQPPPAPSWDAQRHPPPIDSKPEAENFPQTHYEMSSDPAPFVPPERYPSPPRNMWYEVPKEPPAHPHEKPRPIFPWETSQPRATRVFAPDPFETPVPAAETTTDESGSSTIEHKSEPETPTTPTAHVIPSDPWSSFTRTNAWDDVPEIERYVDSIQKHRRTRSQALRLGSLPLAGDDPEQSITWTRRSSKVTDFPSEVERPSLPVTPAPMRRPKFWGGGGPYSGAYGEDDDEGLPAAEGVPAQSDWDPVAQLQKLARQQSELLLQRLGGGSGAGEQPEQGVVATRPWSHGSEDARSPTYVARSDPAPVLSPQPVKPGSDTRRILSSEPEMIPRTAETEPEAESSLAPIPEPSYSGPGLMFEKGEDAPTFETPALPTEEDRDVLET